MRITRRKFMTRAAALGAGLALTTVPGGALLRATRAHAEGTDSSPKNPNAVAKNPAVLYDLTKCAGCHLCQAACQANKGLPEDTTLIMFRKSVTKDTTLVRRHNCMHCLNAACASACPVAAMYKTPEGPVIYRGERCLGCRYCMSACPFNVPQFDWNSGVMDGALIRKCDFCYDRQMQGKKPVCIEACPTGAVVFGEREELLAKAHELIKQNPDRYVDRVYGEKEIGGTRWIVISPVEFEKLGYPEPGDYVLTHLPEAVMKGTIPFALSWATVLSGLTGLMHLRDRAMQANAKPGAHQQHPGKEDRT